MSVPEGNRPRDCPPEEKWLPSIPIPLRIHPLIRRVIRSFVGNVAQKSRDTLVIESKQESVASFLVNSNG